MTQQGGPDYPALISRACREMEAFLLERNAAYGRSAFEPIRVVSSADPLAQLDVRIDDKLSRLFYGRDVAGEDTLWDLAGYILLRRALQRLREETDRANEVTPSVVTRVPSEAVRPSRRPVMPSIEFPIPLPPGTIFDLPKRPAVLDETNLRPPVRETVRGFAVFPKAESLGAADRFNSVAPEAMHGAADGFGGTDFDVEGFVRKSDDDVVISEGQ